MRVIIKNNYDECSLWAAHYVAYKIKAFRPTPEKPFVLGLPTGSTPLGMYQRLIEWSRRKSSLLQRGYVQYGRIHRPAAGTSPELSLFYA